LWCWYRLLHLHLPLPTIVITVIIVTTILNVLPRQRPKRNQTGEATRSRPLRFWCRTRINGERRHT
jgi:hypothetical protein